jgi:lysophospholipase L1-like esterase
MGFYRFAGYGFCTATKASSKRNAQRRLNHQGEIMSLIQNLSTTKRQGLHLTRGSILALFFLASTVWAQESPKEAGRDSRENWVGTWSTVVHPPDLGVPGLANAGFNNQTLRQIVHTSVGGNRVRVRFSTFGAGALVIGEARIGRRAAGGTVAAGSDRQLTFGGKASITIPPNAPVVSDAVDLESPALGDLAVSIYVPGSTGPASWHFESRQTSYISAPGNFTASPYMPVASTATAWFWLAGVEVTAGSQTGAIVAFGDSLTDGAQSTVDANHRWPDRLAQRLMAENGSRQMGVLNEGMDGNRLLLDSLGPNGLARFDRDVLSQTGATHVIVQIGANDISGPGDDVSSDQIIQGYRQLIERAHAKDLKIYGATLTPHEGFLIPGTSIPTFSPLNEAKRQAVNAWIRTSGEYDDVIDFDRVLRDPDAPTRILPSLDSGDHGHPNDEGYKKLAGAISLKLFRETDSH